MPSIPIGDKRRFATKLSNYLALSGSFLLMATDADAQFAIYTDLDPDSSINVLPIDTLWGTISFRGNIDIDINRDGLNDLERVLAFSDDGALYSTFGAVDIIDNGTIGKFAVGTNTFTLSSYCSGTYMRNYPAPLYNGDLVDTNLQFTPNPKFLFLDNTYVYGYDFGIWPHLAASLGIRFDDGTQQYYGWVRMTRGAVFDYAIDPIAENFIEAWPNISATMAPPVHSISTEQIAFNGDFSDFNLSYKIPGSEAGIQEYRLFAVKRDSLASFNLSKAISLPVDRYEVHLPTGVDYNASLSPTLKDTDGDNFAFSQHYHFLVMSVADGISLTDHNLWSCSPTALIKNLDALPGMPVVTDTANHNDGRDIWVDFTKAADENGISAYRLFISKSATIPSVDFLATLPPERYQSVTPTSADIEINLGNFLLDIDGDSIRSDVPYVAFAMSKADGVNLFVDVLSDPSNPFTLQLNEREAQNIVLADVADFNSGADLGVSFDAAVDEIGVASYRAYAIKYPISPFPDLDTLIGLPASHYAEITAGTPPYSLDFDGKTDVHGDPICGTCSYRVMITTIGDYIDFLGDFSVYTGDIVDLSHTAITADSLHLVLVDSVISAAAFELNFDRAPDESAVEEYRVFLSRHATIPEADDLIGLPSDRYLAVTPTGADITINFPSTLKDWSGSAITFSGYYALVLTVPDSIGAASWVLSQPSNSVLLRANLFVANNLIASDVEDLDNGADLGFEFISPPNEAFEEKYIAFPSKVGTYDTSIVATLLPSQYSTFFPLGSPSYAFDLGSLSHDIEGDSIDGDQSYWIHLFTLLNNGYKDHKVVSQSFTLDPLRAFALNLSSDMAWPSGASTDLELNFYGAAKDERLEYYRVFLCKPSNLDTALEAAFYENDPDYFIEISPPFSDVITIDSFPPNLKALISGEVVSAPSSYQAFVLSKTTAATNGVSVVSIPSNQITLVQPTGIEDQNYFDGTIGISNDLILVTPGSQTIQSVTILDILGRAKYRSAASTISSPISIDSRSWSGGIYFVYIELEGKIVSRKFIR